MTTRGPVEVYAAGNMAEAQFVRNLLADAGIEATIVGEPLGMAAGRVPPLLATPRIWVRAGDADRARPVVEEYERRRAERSGLPPFCYHCGHAVAWGESPCPVCCLDLEWEAEPKQRRSVDRGGLE